MRLEIDCVFTWEQGKSKVSFSDQLNDRRPHLLVYQAKMIQTHRPFALELLMHYMYESITIDPSTSQFNSWSGDLKLWQSSS